MQGSRRGRKWRQGGGPEEGWGREVEASKEAPSEDAVELGELFGWVDLDVAAGEGMTRPMAAGS